MTVFSPKIMSSAESRPVTVFGCLSTTLLGAVLGGFLSALVFFLLWSHWVETAYKPAIEEIGDDGGSSEGWVLILGLPPVVLLGALIGVGLTHLLFLWLRKQSLASAAIDVFQDTSRLFRALTTPLRAVSSWTRNQRKQRQTRRRKMYPPEPLN